MYGIAVMLGILQHECLKEKSGNMNGHLHERV